MSNIFYAGQSDYIVKLNALWDRATISIIGNSTSSLDLTVGSKTFTTNTNLQFNFGSVVTITRIADTSRYMSGQVTAYNQATGAITVDVTSKNGTGTYSDWAIALSGTTGAKGDKGDTGDTGAAGIADSISIGTVSSGVADATITGTSPNKFLNLTLQTGDTGAKGDTGDTGDSNVLSIGTVSTGTAAATITGTSPAQVLNLTLPTASPNTLSIGTVTSGTAAATITGTAPNQTLNLTLQTGAKGDKGDTGAKGDTGDTGDSNVLSIGTVAGGVTASATITGTSPAQVLNLILPKGDTGEKGDKGDTGAAGNVFIGTIQQVVFSIVPTGWGLCDGQLVSTASYPDLFTLIGTTYGGDGVTTFGLPDLRGRAIVGAGTGSGLTPITLGSTGGANSATVNSTGTAEVDIAEANLPAHTHTATTHVKVGVNIAGVNTATPGMAGLASTSAFGVLAAGIYAPAGADLGTTYDLGNVTTDIDNTGSGTTLNAPVTTEGSANVMQPYLGLNYIIALEGIVPV